MWRAIEQFAYGPLNLRPEQLGRLTHGEFLKLVEGHRWRERRSMEKMAQLTSWVTAPHVKKPIDPAKLLETKKDKKKVTPEDSKAVLDELMEEMGIKEG